MTRMIVGAMLLAAGTGLGAQEKPVIAIPEPPRAHPVQQPFVLTTLDYGQPVESQKSSASALAELARMFKTSTTIEAALSSNSCQIGDPKFSQAALICMTCPTPTIQIGAEEKKKLGERLLAGGLLYAEHLHTSPAFTRQFKALVEDPLVLGRQGVQWEKVPKDHPLYSCCFEFPDGQFLSGTPDGAVAGLEMVRVRGRVAVIFSEQQLSYYWNNPEAPGREQKLQLGVNLIVFALAQRAARF